MTAVLTFPVPYIFLRGSEGLGGTAGGTSNCILIFEDAKESRGDVYACMGLSKRRKLTTSQRRQMYNRCRLDVVMDFNFLKGKVQINATSSTRRTASCIFRRPRTHAVAQSSGISSPRISSRRPRGASADESPWQK